MNSYIQINTKAFSKNIEIIKSHLSEKSKLCACLKADAYGHGIENLIGFLISADVTSFAISTNDDITKIINSYDTLNLTDNQDLRIIRIRHATKGEVNALLEKGTHIEEMSGSIEHASMLNEAAAKYGVTIKVHININSDLYRDGFILDDENIEILHQFTELKNLKIVGIMTHFADAAEKNLIKTLSLMQRFKRIAAKIKKLAFVDPDTIVHCAASALMIRSNESHMDMVRIGAALYGNRLSYNVPVLKGVTPVLSWKTYVNYTEKIEGETLIGYNHYKITEQVQIASLPIGSSEGYHNALVERGNVILNDTLCPVCSVSLNCILVIAPRDTKIGDTAILIGSSDTVSVTAEDLAYAIGSAHSVIQIAASKSATVEVI
jgi:alanine racemase